MTDIQENIINNSFNIISSTKSEEELILCIYKNEAFTV
jgi:hypothetical protein